MTIVQEFHEVFGQAAPDYIPLRVDADLARFRARLIREEYEEVKAELAMLATDQTPEETRATFGRLLKELADLRYVVEGCAVTFCLPLEDAYAEVHRSNMSKVGLDGKAIFREDGKVLKGPNYTEADMSKFVQPFIEGDIT